MPLSFQTIKMLIFLRFRKHREKVVKYKDNELKDDIDFHSRIHQQPQPKSDFVGIFPNKNPPNNILQNGIPFNRYVKLLHSSKLHHYMAHA